MSYNLNQRDFPKRSSNLSNGADYPLGNSDNSLVSGLSYSTSSLNQPNTDSISPAQIPPKPLRETLKQLPRQYWRVLSHPSAAKFVEEQVFASWGAVWIQLIILSIVGAISSGVFYTFALPTLLTKFFLFAHVPIQNNSLYQMIHKMQILIIPLIFATLIFGIIGFFISASIYWLIAKAFRGKGFFLQYIYCYLLIYVPLGILICVLLLIPFVGFFLIFAPSMYGLVLFIMMTSAIHRMPIGKAALAVLILPIVLTIFTCAINISILLFAIKASSNGISH